MWNEPSKERLERVPNLYETENIPLKGKEIHLHFFIGNSDWFIAEHEGDLMWGFCVLNNDFQNAEWGYISFSELKSLKLNGWLEVDCEIEEVWEVRKASEIKKIRKAHRWPDSEISKGRHKKAANLDLQTGYA